jgi:hypothetical protein
VLLRCPGKEPLSRSYITPSAQEEVDRAASLSTARYRLDPLAAHLDIRLIHTPGVADWPCVMIPALFKLRDILLHPPKNGRMSQQDTAVGHHLDQVTGTELEREIPPHTQHDDFLIKMPSLEQILCRSRLRHSRQLSHDIEPFNNLHQNHRHLDPASVYQNIVRKYGLETGLSAEVMGLCVHSRRATAATNALSHDSDIAKVQEWLGHANVSTTRLYDRRKGKSEDSPTFRVKY